MKEVKKVQSEIDILEINKLRRQLLIQSCVWARRLLSAANAENHSHEEHNGLNPRNKERLNSTGKLVDLSAAPKPQGSVKSYGSLSSDTKTDEPHDHQQGNHDLSCPNFLISPEYGEIDLNVNHEKPRQGYLPTGGMNISDQLDPIAFGSTGQRALSDGQFPIVANLSDSLDAKWTGENGAAALEISMSDSAFMFDAATGALEPEEHSDDQSIAIVADSLAMPPATKEDNVEDASTWIRMPFTSLYQSFNRNNVDSSKIQCLQ